MGTASAGRELGRPFHLHAIYDARPVLAGAAIGIGTLAREPANKRRMSAGITEKSLRVAAQEEVAFGTPQTATF
jgi:hypothetical protein